MEPLLYWVRKRPGRVYTSWVRIRMPGTVPVTVRVMARTLTVQLSQHTDVRTPVAAALDEVKEIAKEFCAIIPTRKVLLAAELDSPHYMQTGRGTIDLVNPKGEACSGSSCLIAALMHERCVMHTPEGDVATYIGILQSYGAWDAVFDAPTDILV